MMKYEKQLDYNKKENAAIGFQLLKYIKSCLHTFNKF